MEATLAAMAAGSEIEASSHQLDEGSRRTLRPGFSAPVVPRCRCRAGRRPGSGRWPSSAAARPPRPR